MLSFFKSSALGAAVLFAVAPLAPAATMQSITLQDGANNPLTGATYEGTQDNQLNGYTNQYTVNHGADERVTAREPSNSSWRRIVLKFDLSSLAGKGTIQSATLTLTESETSGQVADFNFYVYRITDANAGWQEGTSTWNNLDDGSISGTPVSWAGSEGLSTSTNDPADLASDYVATPLATGTYSYGNLDSNTDMNGTAIDLAIPAELIQYWVDHPDKNAGFLIKSSSANYAQFVASEGPDNGTQTQEAWRPALTITYAQVPEPAGGAIVLLGMGLAGLRRRRRHVEC